MTVPLRAAVLALIAWTGWAPSMAADFATELTAAMAPYYGALASSSRGDAESTQRNLVLFAARWAKVRQVEDTAPAVLRGDPAWPATLDRVATLTDRAQALVRGRNLHDAHRELEGVRLALLELRARHGMETLDDHLTRYHESMERVVARASLYNEIILADADYAELSTDLGRARTLWSTVDREAGPVKTAADWRDASRRILQAHDELERLIARREPAAIAESAERMKQAYLELLDVLAAGTER